MTDEQRHQRHEMIVRHIYQLGLIDEEIRALLWQDDRQVAALEKALSSLRDARWQLCNVRDRLRTESP
jgi:hypothetical protein